MKCWEGRVGVRRLEGSFSGQDGIRTSAGCQEQWPHRPDPRSLLRGWGGLDGRVRR